MSCSQAQEKLFQFQRENGTQVPNKLVQDVPTRWNSTYFMFQRIVDLKGSIKSTVAHIKMDHNLLVLTHEEWLIMHRAMQGLIPFEQVTTKMCGEKYLTASQVIVLCFENRVGVSLLQK